MQITKEMISAVKNKNPEITEGEITNILSQALNGQVIFAVGDGMTIIDSKSHWPSYGVVIVNDPLKALELGQQLISGATNAIRMQQQDCSIQLLLAGTAIIDIE